MSKSLGTEFVDALVKIDGELYIFLVVQFTNTVDDIGFNEDDFIQKINSDIVGKYLTLKVEFRNLLKKIIVFCQIVSTKNLYDYLVSESNHVFKLYDAKQFLEGN